MYCTCRKELIAARQFFSYCKPLACTEPYLAVNTLLLVDHILYCKLNKSDTR